MASAETEEARAEARLDREREFHDRKYRQEIGRPRHYRFHPTVDVLERALARVGCLDNKLVLELGCGDGWITARLRRCGARVLSCDISPVGLRVAMDHLRRAGLAEGCLLARMPAERLGLLDNSCEAAFGFAILHHLDLKEALPELLRVLRPGARAVFCEPLEGNPGLRLFRQVTPQYRTPDERALCLRAFLDSVGEGWRVEHEELFLLALLAFPLAYLPGGDHLFRPAVNALHKADRLLLRVFPALGAWAWYTILTLVKA